MDMLIKLYALPACQTAVETLGSQGIRIRRAMAYERAKVTEWVEQTFNPLWADECVVAFGRRPVGCYIAVQNNAVCGFCCLDTTFQNFIGPIGVHRDCRSRGVGRGLLLLSAASELHLNGYAYAVVGDAGEPEFFKRSAGALEIPDSTPGAYPPKISY